jgi:hypothetical protein
MSRARRGKGKGKPTGRGGGNKQSYEADEQDVEVFNTFKMLSEQFDNPDPSTYDPSELYDFPIISTEWLKKLEAHVKGEGPLPTERVNEDLLDEDKHNDQDRVFEWGKKRGHYNCILKKKIKFNKDYVLCPDAVWSMIKETHNAVTIIRRFYVDNKRFVQCGTDYEVAQVVFIDDCKSIFDLKKYLVVYHVQYYTDDKFLWLTDYLQDLHFDDVTKEDVFTYFKVDNRITAQNFFNGLKDQINDVKDDKGTIDLTFRGYPLDYDEDDGNRLYMSELFWPRSTCIILRNARYQPFVLNPQKLDLQPNPEICEYCDEKLQLTIACECKQVFYCSIKCRTKNIPLHKKFCSYAVHIEPLLELQEEYKVGSDFKFDVGLVNLGNTCYFSSVLQVLRVYPPLYKQLQSLDRNKLLELNRKELNIYPYLHDAFMRASFGGDKQYAPYLLKAAVGIKNTNVLLADGSSSGSIRTTLWSFFRASSRYFLKMAKRSTFLVSSTRL